MRTFLLQMYNVKQTQSEIHELKEKLSIQQQKNQLNELSNEREGELWSEENQFAFITNLVVEAQSQCKFNSILIKWFFLFNLYTISSVSINKDN